MPSVARRLTVPGAAGGVASVVDASGTSAACKVETGGKPAETGPETPEKYRDALKRYFSREGDRP